MMEDDHYFFYPNTTQIHTANINNNGKQQALLLHSDVLNTPSSHQQDQQQPFLPLSPLFHYSPPPNSPLLPFPYYQYYNTTTTTTTTTTTGQPYLELGSGASAGGCGGDNMSTSTNHNILDQGQQQLDLSFLHPPPKSSSLLIRAAATCINDSTASTVSAAPPRQQMMDNNPTENSASMKKSEGREKPRKRCSRRDRHSKIETAQGPRDRRMRLSLKVSRPFFGLQDKLGFDKPSKTVEWLLNQSRPHIDQLFSVNTSQQAEMMMKMNCMTSSTSCTTATPPPSCHLHYNIACDPATVLVEGVDSISSSVTEDHPNDKEIRSSSQGPRSSSCLLKKTKMNKKKKTKTKKGNGQKRTAAAAITVRREARDKARARARQRTKAKLPILSICRSTTHDISTTTHYCKANPGASLVTANASSSATSPFHRHHQLQAGGTGGTIGTEFQSFHAQWDAVAAYNLHQHLPLH